VPAIASATPRAPTATRSFLARTLVLIPALNEAGNIRRVVDYWRTLGAGAVRVVDNGSTDATARLALAAGAEVVSEPQRGYGAACQAGLAQVPEGIEWILFSAADGSDRLSTEELAAWERAAGVSPTVLTDPGNEERWNCRQGAGRTSAPDFILGNRCATRASRRRLTWPQRTGSRIASLALRLGWGAQMRDMGSLRLIRVEALRRLGLRDRGFGWNIEMQVRAVEESLRFVELPVAHHPRLTGESKISGNLRGSLLAAVAILAMLGQLWWTKRQRQNHPAAR
jgi:glycosyltransferase involved in cell wall biosynthesis